MTITPHPFAMHGSEKSGTSSLLPPLRSTIRSTLASSSLDWTNLCPPSPFFYEDLSHSIHFNNPSAPTAQPSAQTPCPALHQQGWQGWKPSLPRTSAVRSQSPHRFKVHSEARCSPEISAFTATSELKLSSGDEQGGEHVSKISALKSKNDQKQQ